MVTCHICHAMAWLMKWDFVCVVQGAIVCGRFCPDDPYVLAIGGQRNGFNLLNVLSYPPRKLVK